MDWEGAQISTTGLAASQKASGYVVLPSAVRDFYTDPTLMFTHVYLQMKTEQATGSPWGAIGLGIITWSDINDVAPLSADAPGPINNTDLDWIWRFVQPVGPLSASSYYGQLLDSSTMSKAKRRLGSDHGILVVAENLTSASLAFYMDVRVLIKE
jgi:hypothetical protein